MCAWRRVWLKKKKKFILFFFPLSFYRFSFFLYFFFSLVTNLPCLGVFIDQSKQSDCAWDSMHRKPRSPCSVFRAVFNTLPHDPWPLTPVYFDPWPGSTVSWGQCSCLLFCKQCEWFIWIIIIFFFFPIFSVCLILSFWFLVGFLEPSEAFRCSQAPPLSTPFLPRCRIPNGIFYSPVLLYNVLFFFFAHLLLSLFYLNSKCLLIK